MVNTFALSIIRLVHRLFILLTLACVAYIIYSFLFKNQDSSMSETMTVPHAKADSSTALSPAPVLDLKAYSSVSSSQVRDIFSLTPANPLGPLVSTPKGQLPDYLKVVGVLIAHPSQIVIEDTSTHTTFFIDEGHVQNGIKIVKADKDKMTINYQGQDILLPVTKN